MENKDNLELLEKGKYYYDLCVKCNWNFYKALKSENISIVDMKKYVRYYITTQVKEPISEELFLTLLDTKAKNLFTIYSSLINKMIARNLIDANYLKNLLWVNDYLRQELGKFCYSICEKNCWITLEVEKALSKEGIEVGVKSVKLLANEYINDVLKLSKEEKAQMLETRGLKQKAFYSGQRVDVPTSEYAKVYDKLLYTEEQKDIISLLEEFGKEPGVLRLQLPSFVNVYHKASNRVYQVLLEKINIYAEYYHNQRLIESLANKKEKKLERLEFSKRIINQYIDEGTTNKKFCEANNIPYGIFRQCVLLVKENDPELHSLYLCAVNKTQTKLYAELMNNARLMVEMIQNGVEENGKIRPFDLIDYYECTNLNFDQIIRLFYNRNATTEYITLKIFCQKYMRDRYLTQQDIIKLYESKTVVGIKFDERGNVIPGTGKEITKEEKQCIIEYLCDKKIPLTKNTYNIALSRLYDQIIKSEDKVKVKRK